MLRPRRQLPAARQRRHREQPRLGLLLPADHRLAQDRGPARASRRRTGSLPEVQGRWCAATWPATTGTCRTSAARTGSRTRACKGKPWVQPITDDRRLPALLPAHRCWRARTWPSTASPRRSRPRPSLPACRRGAAARHAETARGLADNAADQGGGLATPSRSGEAGTRDHKHGLLLGNPHFPWLGPSASTRRRPRSRAR